MLDTISVVIPVFNGESFILQAVQSALDQTKLPHEVIVVNDGSTDGTLELLLGFGTRIRTISIPNGGVANARNVGILASSGAYIAFLDADDTWLDCNLETQLACLQKYPEIGFCCCDFLTFASEKGVEINHFSRFSTNHDFVFDQPLVSDAFDLLLQYNFVGTCSNVMVRRKVLDKIGLFNPSFRQAEDYDLWLRCAETTNFFISSSLLVNKRTHQANLTNNQLETLFCHEDVLLRLRTHRRSILQGERLYKSGLALAKVRYQIGNLLFDRGEVFNAFKYFFRGVGVKLSLNNLALFFYYSSRKLGRLLMPKTVSRFKQYGWKKP
jgi:glycosyltransferase involved in cell wall biosynthesis